jgi:antiphage defense system Thoeris ThsB-like protein
VAENPFDCKNLGLLNALEIEHTRSSLPCPSTNLDLIADRFGPTTGGLLATLYSSSLPVLSATPPTPLGSLFAPWASSPLSALYVPIPKSEPIAPQTKRKAFFSFHFDDIMRVNNVRNGWKISHPHSASNRSFYDSSLWEARKLENPESIKQLIRCGVMSTSTVCVLAGSETWDRRWVRYEIARAIIDDRGLLTVHINRINHHRTKGPHPTGRNPLAHMGIAKIRPNERLPPQYFLYEMDLVPDGYGRLVQRWSRYKDYTTSVKKPAWLTDPILNHVVPLSVDTTEYDYELDLGHCNIGSWIDKAATQAGR